jgi:hypothetical protein
LLPAVAIVPRGRRLPRPYGEVAKVRRTLPASRAKVAHIVPVTHRDEVEAPLTDWLREAYEVSERLSARRPKKRRVTMGKRKAGQAR